jgi:uncharacterized protein involved in outer membrane biogenesis
MPLRARFALMSSDDQSFERAPRTQAPKQVPASGAETPPEPVSEPSHAGDRWARLRRIPAPIRWLLAALAVVLVALVAVILFLANPDWDWARPTLRSMIASRTHRPVRIDGHLRVHLFSFTPDATVTGLHIGEPVSGVAGAPRDDLAAIDSLFVRAEMMPALYGHIVLPRVEVTRPNLVLFQDKQGHANWDFSNGANAGKPVKLPLIKNFIIDDGHLKITSLQRRLVFTGTIYAHEKADAGGQAFGMTGDGSLNAKVFKMNATGGPLLNVRSTVPYPFDMVVTAGDTRIAAKGRVLHPFDLGRLDAAMSLSGNDLADLYYLTGLTFPNTPRYSVSAQVNRDNMIYTIDGIRGRVGSSDVEGAMKVDTSNHGRPYLTGDLRSRMLDFKDLGSVFGATAANRPHAPQLKLTAPQAPQAANRLLPDAPLDIERVRGMDAKVRYRALSVKASTTLPLREVSLGVALDHGLLTLDPIDFSFPQGRLQGNARIDARHAVQTNTVDMRLTGFAVQNAVPKFQGAAPIEGILDARAKLDGTGNSVHKAASTANGEVMVVMPGGTVRQSLAELMGIDATKGLFMLLAKDPHQTDVRCAVADFKVNNGIMQAQNITFDTGVVVVNGSGTINLNDESLKLTLNGKAKKFRLVKLNAPILIGGHLSSPTFGINAGPVVAQGGLGALLSTVSAPLLALPFLNLHGAPDANCAGLLAQASAQGAPTTTHAAPKKYVPAPKVH